MEIDNQTWDNNDFKSETSITSEPDLAYYQNGKVSTALIAHVKVD